METATQTKLNGQLQYQESNGTWSDVDKERTESFLNRIIQNNGKNAEGSIVPIHRAEKPLSKEEAIEALNAGKTLRNDTDDWYAVSRIKPVEKSTAPLPKANELTETGTDWYDRKVK